MNTNGEFIPILEQDLEGSRIRLTSSPDPYTMTHKGDTGIVQRIWSDDETEVVCIDVAWDNSNTGMSLLQGIDDYEVID